MKTIPVSATNRREIVQSLKSARAELVNGQVVCTSPKAPSVGLDTSCRSSGASRESSMGSMYRLFQCTSTNCGAVYSALKMAAFSGNGQKYFLPGNGIIWRAAAVKQR